jgi:DNA-binding MarR family transcriptional regulator
MPGLMALFLRLESKSSILSMNLWEYLTAIYRHIPESVSLRGQHLQIEQNTVTLHPHILHCHIYIEQAGGKI